MLKTTYKNLISGGIILLAWIAYSIASQLLLIDSLNGLTVVVFISVLLLGVEDAVTKLLYQRELITWQYVVLLAFTLACDMLWVFMARCSTFMQMFGRGILLAIAIAGTVVWAFYAYRISVLSDTERKKLRLTHYYKKFVKKFPKMSDEEVRKVLESALFCYLENDSLEGSLLINQPFSASLFTFNDLVAADGSTSDDVANVIDAYISKVISNRKKEIK